MNKQVHFNLSPIHFTKSLLDSYGKWIPGLFPMIHNYLRESLKTTYKQYPYNPHWDSVHTMLAKHFSDQSIPHFHQRIVELLPTEHQFRYDWPVKDSDQESYRQALIDFLTLLTHDTNVRDRETKEVVKLWSAFKPSKQETIGLLEAKIL